MSNLSTTCVTKVQFQLIDSNFFSSLEDQYNYSLEELRGNPHNNHNVRPASSDDLLAAADYILEMVSFDKDVAPTHPGCLTEKVSVDGLNAIDVIPATSVMNGIGIDVLEYDAQKIDDDDGASSPIVPTPSQQLLNNSVFSS